MDPSRSSLYLPENNRRRVGVALFYAPAYARSVNRFLNLPSSVDELQDASSKDEKPEKPENLLMNYKTPWSILLRVSRHARSVHRFLNLASSVDEPK